MTDKQLQDKLEKLRREVDRVAGDDPGAREQLDRLIGDIEKRLALPSDSELHDNLLLGLKDTISQFETDHPRATAILNDIMVLLSNVGI